MRVDCVRSLRDVPAEAWNRLAGGDHAFLRHEFLSGLERHGCLEPHGWQPLHLIATDAGRLCGAMPLYLKSNSYGEFVFDWAWAEACERAGGRYYPKLVSAIPFTPVSGPRILVAPDGAAADAVAGALVDAAIELTERLDLSSLHCLFPPESQAGRLHEFSGLLRTGCQYHWHNPGYRDFEDFLDQLNAKHRRQIRRERREVREAGIEVEVLDGHRITDAIWRTYHDFYCSTFRRKWGEPRLTLRFFQALGRAMPAQTLLFLAREQGRCIAGGFAMRSGRTLYGRHWGCSGYHRHLHFEVCYYQTIDYCIRNGLAHLDAGAQGEHKLSRGFLPVRTWSVHWLRDSGLRRAVADFLKQETTVVERYISDLAQHTPYRRTGTPPA